MACAIPAAAGAAPGDLDPSFSRDGKVTSAIKGCEEAGAVAVQPDGKILVAGGRRAPSSKYRGYCEGREVMIVARFLPNGKLDPGFADRGIATLPPERRATALALRPDGRIFVGGDRFVISLLPDGSLDPSFGTGGTLTGVSFTVGALEVQPSGKLLVGGSTIGAGFCPSTCFAIGRVLPDGTPDGTFGGGDGITTAFYPHAYAAIRRMVIQPDGRIVAAGTFSGGSPGGGLMFARFEPDGDLDPTFGSEIDPGMRAVNDSRRPYFTGGGTDLALQPDGKPVAVGQIDAHLGAVRLDTSGSLDPSFDGDGITQAADFTPLEEIARGRGIGITSTGAILAAGTTARIGLDPGSGGRSSISVREDFALARFDPQGRLDPAFGAGNGQRSTDFYTDDDEALGGGLTPNGRFAIGGTVDDVRTGPDLGVAVYLNSPGRSDADADGLKDGRDRCPEAFASKGNGCPALGRKLRLEYQTKKDRFRGTVVTRYLKCLGGKQRVALMYTRPGHDRTLLQLEINSGGGFGTKYGAPRGRYYAQIPPLDLTNRGHCAKDRSRTLDLP